MPDAVEVTGGFVLATEDVLSSTCGAIRVGVASAGIMGSPHATVADMRGERRRDTGNRLGLEWSWS